MNIYKKSEDMHEEDEVEGRMFGFERLLV